MSSTDCLIQVSNCPVPSTEMSRSIPKCPGPSTEMSRYRDVQVPRFVLTDGRQQRQPYHNTTTYCVYWRKTTTTQSPSVNTICGDIIIGLSLLSSVSKHNMWSYYDWVYCCCRPSVNTICGRIMINNDNPIIIPPNIVLTDGRQQRQPNDNTTTYCVYWRTTTTINPIIIWPHCMCQ
jgi:hypothetical protein